MLYYRVKPEYDNRQRFVFVGHSNLKVKPDGILIAHELYTPRERERLAVHDKHFVKVEISRKKTYWFFGARLSNEKGVPVK